MFWFRHYIQDKGRFPDHMLEDLDLKSQDLGERRAGILPYLTIAAAAVVVLASHFYFQLPSPAAP